MLQESLGLNASGNIGALYGQNFIFHYKVHKLLILGLGWTYPAHWVTGICHCRSMLCLFNPGLTSTPY